MRAGGGRPAGPAVLAATVLAAAVAVAIVAARGPEAPRTLDERVHAIAETLRCPVCQNLSVADSPAPLARQMRETIERQLRAGRSPEEIRAGFVAAYGEWILQAPPARGINLLAWVGPAALFLVGAIVIAVTVRRWTAGARRARRPPALPEDDRRLLQRELAKVREEPE